MIVAAIGKDAAEAHAGRADPVNLGKGDLGVGPVRTMAIGHTARSSRAASDVQLSDRNNRNPTMTDASPEASVSDTSVWQLDASANVTMEA